MRAHLIVSPDGPASLEAARDCAADALVLDAGAAGCEAWTFWREANGDSLGRPPLHVRVGALFVPGFERELRAAMAVRPQAIVLPAGHGRDVARLGARLAVLEAEQGVPDGTTTIVALIASAAGALDAVSFVGASPRLSGLGWDAAALARELRAERVEQGRRWTPPLAQARGLVLLAAAAAGVEAVETMDPGDGPDGFRDHVAAARRDGFGAVLVADAAQIAAVRTMS